MTTAKWEPPPPPVRRQTQGSWTEEIVARLEDDGPVFLGSCEVWAMQSESDPMKVHYVFAVAGEGLVCDCKGFRFRGRCRHTSEIGLDDAE